MIEKKGIDFCIECRKETAYVISKVQTKEVIRDKEYSFNLSNATCTVCGSEMSLPGLIDLNIQERDMQYRKIEHIISIEEIKKLMKIYRLGKAPLSLALGFGEITITRYLDQQMPSKNYSDIMKKALISPAFMEKLLKKNRIKVGEVAYKKAMNAINEIQETMRISKKLLAVISYIFELTQDITPLALQKLLYYVQALSNHLNHEPIFSEECYAWQHGPVYKEVYTLFKDFKFNPIEDARFSLLSDKSRYLDFEETHVIDIIVQSFGLYSGKVLEKITHNEYPWMKARYGYEDCEPSNVLIKKEHIEYYFNELSKKYNLYTIEGLQSYISSVLYKA